MTKSSHVSNRLPGFIIIAAVIIVVSLVLIAQHLYPNYSLTNNYISDLGVGSTAPIFNTGIVLFGLLIVIASYFIYRADHRLGAIGFAIAGLGAMGVGLFPETTGLPHIISAIVTFGGVAFTAIGFYRIFRKPVSYYSVAAGLVGVFVMALFIVNLVTGLKITFGLGHGGVEEILFYNEVIWALAVGISIATRRI